MPRRLLFLFLLAGLLAAPLSAQNTPSDYEITPGNKATLTENGQFIVIQVTVTNRGGDARDEATIRLLDLNDNENLASAPLLPLQANEQTSVELSFQADRFAAGSRQPLRIEILSGSIRVRSVDITIDIPSPANQLIVVRLDSIYIPLLDLTIDTSSPLQVGLLTGAAVIAIILLLIVVIILRLMLTRPPAFGTWQPPYASIPPMNPDSISGRRQLWQQHAQNSSLPVQCAEGNVQARKMLLGMDGQYLSGWKLLALRLSQYDMYGRVARSQVLASGRLVRRLDRIAHKAKPQDLQRREKQIRPIAQRLAKQLNPRINKRNAMLPIALDVRFQGIHGEVRIIFELFQCRQGGWQQIDQWEPEMTVVSKTIYDSFTYTLYGQMGGETLKEFRQRLQHDLTRALVSLTDASVVQHRTPPDTVANVPFIQPEI